MFGLNEADFSAIKLKIDRQKKFLQDYKFVNYFGEEKSLLSVSKSANFSSTYYAEVANRTNTIHMLSVKHELVPVFLTITLNGCFRKALVGNFAAFTTKDIRSLPIEQKQKLNEGVPFSIKDLANVLNYNFHKFTKRFRFAYKGEVFQYIRTFEPHKKDGVSHIHALIYASKHTIPYLLKIYKDVFCAPQNLRNERLTAAQIANGEINGFQTSINNATGYVMKYITKTFINFNETDDINEVQAWFIKHKIRRFLSSQNPIPLWVYRKINFIKSLRDLGNLNILKDFDNTLIDGIIRAKVYLCLFHILQRSLFMRTDTCFIMSAVGSCTNMLKILIQLKASVKSNLTSLNLFKRLTTAILSQFIIIHIRYSAPLGKI